MLWLLALACSVENDFTPASAVGPDVEAPTDSGSDSDFAPDSGGDTGAPDVVETDAPDSDPQEPETDAPVDTGEEPEIPTGLSCDTSVPAADVAYCTSGVAAVLGASTPYGTVQGAISAASSSDVVTVCPGIWTENLVVNRPLSIVGHGASTSVLSGGGVGRVLRANAGPLLLMNVGVTGGSVAGYGDSGGGISAGAGDLCVVNSDISGNYASYDGGGLDFYGSAALEVAGSTFTDNTAGYEGGGISVSGGATVAVQDASFAQNTAVYGGGGMRAGWECTVDVADSTFAENYAGYDGGGLKLGGRAAGGGVRLERVDFLDNEADYGGGGVAGGGWEFYTLSARDCLFARNLAGNEGGGVSTGSWGGVDFYAESSTFTGNGVRSTGGTGGAVDLGGWGVHTAELVDCTLEANFAPSGGALGGSNRGTSDFVVTGGSVTGNLSASGGGAALDADATLTVTGSDWGTGASDNAPNDVSAGSSYGAYGAAATFTCAASVCL